LFVEVLAKVYFFRFILVFYVKNGVLCDMLILNGK